MGLLEAFFFDHLTRCPLRSPLRITLLSKTRNEASSQYVVQWSLKLAGNMPLFLDTLLHRSGKYFAAGRRHGHSGLR